MKMNVLVVASTREESERIRNSVFDFKFQKVSSGYVGMENIAKDCHAIIAHSTNDTQISQMTALLERYEKYTIKVVFGEKTELVNDYIGRGWQHFDLAAFEDMKSHIKKAFDDEVEKIKNIFEQIDEDHNGYLSPVELTYVSQKLGTQISKEEIDECVKIIDTDGNGQITFDEFALWWIAGREGASESFKNYLMETTK